LAHIDTDAPIPYRFSRRAVDRLFVVVLYGWRGHPQYFARGAAQLASRHEPTAWLNRKQRHPSEAPPAKGVVGFVSARPTPRDVHIAHHRSPHGTVLGSILSVTWFGVHFAIKHRLAVVTTVVCLCEQRSLARDALRFADAVCTPRPPYTFTYVILI